MFISDCINKEDVIHIYITVVYFSAMKKDAILVFVTIWMDLKHIMSSKIGHIQKDRYHMLSLICGI